MFLLLGLFSFTAAAFQSDNQLVGYDDTTVLFENIATDSGWIPNSGPIGIRFEFLTNGGAELSGEGESELSWNEDGARLHFFPKENSGLFAITTQLEWLVSLRFDINLWAWEGELFSESIVFENEMEYSPFLLDDQEPNRLVLMADAAGLLIYDFIFEVIPAVADVSFYLELEPQLEVGAEGIGWYNDGQLAEQSDDSLVVTLNENRVEYLPSYVAAFDAQLDMSVNPVVEVCVLFICNDWTPVEIPFEVISEQQEKIFPPSNVIFPLPNIHIENTSVDFGTVEVGETLVFELPISNDGLWYLEGSTMLFGGSGALSNYPNLILAGPESTDGVIIQLSPSEVGEIEGVLQIHTNDPNEPLIEVYVQAIAIDPLTADTDTDESVASDKVSAPVGGCGCTTAQGRSHWILSFFPFGVLVLRRRQ